MDPAESASKIIFVGDAGVGKTSIARRQAFDNFDLKMLSTLGVDRFFTRVPVQGETIELTLWDTAGQERFAELVPIYARGAAVCVLVASVTDENSWDRLAVWQDRVKTSSPGTPFIAAFNKTDLMPDSTLTGRIHEMYGEQFPNLCFVSAQNGAGIEEMFQAIAILALQRIREQHAKEPTPELESTDKGAACC
jgi:small GTP-binding protein